MASAGAAQITLELVGQLLGDDDLGDLGEQNPEKKTWHCLMKLVSKGQMPLLTLVSAEEDDICEVRPPALPIPSHILRVFPADLARLYTHAQSLRLLTRSESVCTINPSSIGSVLARLERLQPALRNSRAAATT